MVYCRWSYGNKSVPLLQPEPFAATGAAIATCQNGPGYSAVERARDVPTLAVPDPADSQFDWSPLSRGFLQQNIVPICEIE